MLISLLKMSDAHTKIYDIKINRERLMLIGQFSSSKKKRTSDIDAPPTSFII